MIATVADLAGLEPDHRVLDLGCGPGRMVSALRRRLGPAGRYEGLDIVPEFVRWNQRWVTPVDPRFRFQRAAVRNDSYFPEGGPAAEYTFPYPDSEFDRIIAASIFTHLNPDAALRYLHECSRVLAPGGRLFATFFILDDQVRARLDAGRSTFRFGWPAEFGAVENPREPEFARAYERWAVAGGLAAAGLRAIAPPWSGTWSGVEGPTYQDVVVAEKAGG
jgi:SAM-dependent methyltransferase